MIPLQSRRSLIRDGVGHDQRDCSAFKEALRIRLIGFNEKGRVKVVATGEELSLGLMNRKGGMKMTLKIQGVRC